MPGHFTVREETHSVHMKGGRVGPWKTVGKCHSFAWFVQRSVTLITVFSYLVTGAVTPAFRACWLQDAVTTFFLKGKVVPVYIMKEHGDIEV
jgi:hypothetical protein